ncbi:phage tail protein [Pseudomonas sp. HLS-6]|uniref:phage tail assembly chaperone n=1 Tax=Pseudomonas sp. HLS-6 TaxID=2049589 RepID=UPI000C18955B|nr:phage tail assembly chaperone [Pseudomonas sp. HLS-6]ATR83073.1 phage tail protein [Pseudomonas sp. HLS-6]
MKYAVFDPVTSVLIGRFDSRRCDVPEGAIEISEETFLRSINERDGQWVRNSDGGVIKIPFPARTAEQLADDERAWRNAEINATQWLSARHRDQQEIGADTTLTSDQFQELLVYMQALRDWPQSEQFPVIEHRPVAPPWIAEQHQ